MYTMAAGSGASPSDMMDATLAEKLCHVVDQRDHVNLLRDLGVSPAMVDNEKRLLKRAVDDLLNDVDIHELLANFGVQTFTDYLNYVVGTRIEYPKIDGSGLVHPAISVERDHIKGWEP